MQIEPLADYPAYIPVLAEWFYAEWPGEGRTQGEIEMQLRQNLQRDTLPITWVAVEEGLLCGSVSLDVDDLAGWEHLSPWLASLYVKTGCRGAGLGKRLVRHVMHFAREREIPTLHLWTPGSAGFYEALGWRVAGSDRIGGHEIILMKVETDSSQEPA